MNHTPTPYRMGNINSLRQSVRILDSHGFLVAEGRAAGGPFQVACGNAAFIVRACNAHDELVKTLGRVEANLTVDTATRLGIYKALKLARGE